MLRIVRIATVLSLFVLATVAQAQQANFTVGTATAARGQKATGYIDVCSVFSMVKGSTIANIGVIAQKAP